MLEQDNLNLRILCMFAGTVSLDAIHVLVSQVFALTLSGYPHSVFSGVQEGLGDIDLTHL